MHKIAIEIVIEIVIEFLRTSSTGSEKFWLKSTKNQSQNEHGYFYATGSAVQKIGRAQADFFREVGGAYQYLCRARAMHDVITSTSSLLRRS